MTCFFRTLIFSTPLLVASFAAAQSPDTAPDLMNTASLIRPGNLASRSAALNSLAGTGSDTAKSANGELNATMYPGTDIGEQVNAAIADLPRTGGTVFIPASATPYVFTHTIFLPRVDKLRGLSAYGTVLKYTATSGWAVVMADGTGPSIYPAGALEDLSLVGPAGENTAGGIYIGGSDGVAGSPSLASDPSRYYGDHVNINRVRVFNSFNTGVQFGNNTWSVTIFESVISNNGTGVYFPAGLKDAGENISLVNTSVQNSAGVARKVGAGNLDLDVINSSFDYNGSWAIQNLGSTITLTNSHVEQPDHWLQNAGSAFLIGDYFSNGSKSGVLGYLIDNQALSMTATGGAYLNSESGAILNPEGAVSNWIGVVANRPLLPTGVNIDRFGNINGKIISGSRIDQPSASQFSGVSACAGGQRAITLPFTFAAQQAVVVFDETTKGGASLSAKGRNGFVVSCAGATDAFDWLVIGNPN
jgi:hypothetical protein